MRRFDKDKLEALMLERGLGVEDVAREVGCDPSSVSLWRSGERSPSPRFRRKLAQFFRMPVSAFLAGMLLLAVAAPAAADAYDDNVAIMTIMGEAGGDTVGSMIGVGEVIRNRAILSGRGFADVCLAPRQFAFWNDRDRAGAWLEENADDGMLVKARFAWAFSAGSDIARGATRFESADFEQPEGLELVARAGKHLFYREN